MAKAGRFGYKIQAVVQGVLAVVLVLLAVLALLALDGVLLIPGLILAYTLTGIPWHWPGVLPDPLSPPGPWLSMGVGVIATLVPALLDGVVLHFLLRKKVDGNKGVAS